MYMLLSYPTGRFTDAILLSATPERMRFVVRDQDDTLELCRIGAHWISDAGSPVEIHSLVAGNPAAVSSIWTEQRPRAAGAAY